MYSLHGDSNEKRLKELYKEALAHYNKQVPVFILNNKVDSFIDYLSKNRNGADTLSVDILGDSLEPEEIIKEIDNEVVTIQNELISIQNKNRKNTPLISLPCYLMVDERMPRELRQKYNVIHAIQTIFEKMASYLKNTAIKIKVGLSDVEADLIPVVDQNRVKMVLQDLLTRSEVESKVFNPANLNISQNVGKTPHGNGYNALRRRLQYGSGYTSNIDENYFIYCQSFSIDFPGNLRNLFTSELIMRLEGETLSYTGGHFIHTDGEKQLNSLIAQNHYINEYDIANEMLYRYALLKAEGQNSFGYGIRFNSFLENCIPFFNKESLDFSTYVQAVSTVLLLAANRAISLHVLYS